VGQPLAGGSHGPHAIPGPQVRGTGGTQNPAEARIGCIVSPVPRCEGQGAARVKKTSWLWFGLGVRLAEIDSDNRGFIGGLQRLAG